MSCIFDKEKLTGYFDGELENAGKLEVETHISACSECLRELSEIKAAAKLVRELPHRPAPASIAEGVRREKAGASRFRLLKGGLLWATAAAAGVLLVVNVIYFSGSHSEAPADGGLAKQSAPALGYAPASEADRSLAEEDESKNKDALRRDRWASREELKKVTKAVQQKSDEDRPAAGPGVDQSREKENRKADALPPAPEAPAAKRQANEVLTHRELDKLKDLRAGDSTALESLEVPVYYTVASSDMKTARPRVEEILKSVGAAPEAGFGHGVGNHGAAVPSITVELTDAQLARLKMELEKQKNLVVAEGLQDGALAFAGRGEKAGGAPLPSPARAPADMTEGKEGAGRLGKGKESPAAEKTDPKAEEPSLDKERQGELSQKPLAKAAPRRKIVLYFKELPAAATPAEAGEKK